jgi:hypothetical protein
MNSIFLKTAAILIVVMIIIIVGIYYGYNISNKVIYASFHSITIYNTQNIPTPSPFQQDIAICNDNINIGPNFAYVNNPILFNEIDSNGQNVYFTTTNGSAPNIYSWYEGQLINGSTYCDVWWIKLPNGIPANSNVTIYMNIGPNNANYYQQYYPYVGTNEQVIGTMQYDNGQNVFIAYGYFDNTFDGWRGYIYHGFFSPMATSNGVEMINFQGSEGTYILPPNNWNIPKIPLIVEEAWYDKGLITYSIHGKIFVNADSNIISLFGNTSQQIKASSIGLTLGVYTPTSNLSTFVQFDYYYGITFLASTLSNSIFGISSYISFPTSGGTFYSYLIVNSSYAQAGYYKYNSNQVWVPLTLLDTYTINNNKYTYANLNYNPFQYGTLEIGAGTGVYDTSYQYIEWVVARAYPPNGVMPSIYIS